MNKKIIAAAACGALLSGIVCADDMKFYVGGDLGYNKLGYTSDFKQFNSLAGIKDKSKSPSATIVVGVRTHENFGAEVGYTFYKKVKFNSIATGNEVYNIKLNDIHVDLLGYMPINECFEVIGSFGAGRYNQKETYVVGQNTKESLGALRLGAGVQYKFDEHFATRAMVRYNVLGTKNQDIKNVTSLNLGLTYTI